MAKKKQTTVKVSETKFFLMQVLGVVSLLLAVVALFGEHTQLAVLAMVCAGVSIWAGMSVKHYHFLFVGMVALMIGLQAITVYASQLSFLF